MTRTVCHGCRAADVDVLLAERGPTKADPDTVQAAYAQSVVSMPDTKVGAGFVLAAATAKGAAYTEPDPAPRRTAVADATTFAATLGAIPPNAEAAEIFFAYSRRAFYLHVRSLLRTLDGRKRLAPRRRDDAKRPRTNAVAQKEANRALALALRFMRIHMRAEIIPLALKLDCSKTQVWHLEGGENVVQDKWVQRYARVFDVPAASIYAFAGALRDMPDATDPKAGVIAFVQHVLAAPVDAAPAPATRDMQREAGADKHTTRPIGGASKRTHPGTGRPMNKALGQALRYVRVTAEIDVPEFAATAGISPSHVYNLECDRKSISEAQVTRYARATGCTNAQVWQLADALLVAGDDVTPALLREWYENIFITPTEAA